MIEVTQLFCYCRYMSKKTLKMECPHCYAKNIDFVMVYRHKVDENISHDIFACSHCNHAVILEKQKKNNKWIFVQSFPEGSIIEVPKYLPNNIENFLIQGIKSLPENPDAAGAMFRKSLEVGLNHIMPEHLKDKSIYSQIQLAVKQNYISDELGQWADIIRIDGNEATHSVEPFNVDQAEILRQFTEIFLSQIFTLPTLVKKRAQMTKKYHGRTIKFTSKRG